MELISSSDFDSKVIESDIPVLVDFYAQWCGPCRVYAPILEKIADKLEGKLAVVKINVDKHQEISQKYNIRSIPTSIIFKDGSPQDTFIGALPEEELLTKLEQYI